MHNTHLWNDVMVASQVNLSMMKFEPQVDCLRITNVGLSWFTYADAIMQPLLEWLLRTPKVHIIINHTYYILSIRTIHS